MVLLTKLFFIWKVNVTKKLASKCPLPLLSMLHLKVLTYLTLLIMHFKCNYFLRTVEMVCLPLDLHAQRLRQRTFLESQGE